jgi:mitogen-activated protein kinase 15
MMERMLQFNPNKRMSLEEALAHPYVAEFHNSEAEPMYEGVVHIPVDDNVRYAINDYRDVLYKQIRREKKEQRRARHERKMNTSP